MDEITQIIEAAGRLREQGEDSVLATVVATDGSTYRQPGARMLIARSGRVAGSVSGGCLEEDLVRKAWWRTEKAPSVVAYDSRTDEDDPLAWAFGLGCNGIVQVLLERLPVVPDAEEDTLSLVENVYQTRSRGVIALCYSGERIGQRLLVGSGSTVSGRLNDAPILDVAQAVLRTGISQVMPGSTPDEYILVEAILPPPAIVLVGSGPDVAPLSQLCASLGWQTTVVAARAFRADTSCYPGARLVTRQLLDINYFDARTAVVLMTHSLEADEEALQHVLPSSAGYIGMLGPRRRAVRLFERLGADLEADSRIHAPVGFNIGAEGGAQVAVSIVAEVQAWLAGRDGHSLRERDVPIHNRNTVPLSSTPEASLVCGLVS